MAGQRQILSDRGFHVSLVFPPLVDTNFGNYYPSTAVLAAYLSENGIRSVQRDLNEEFAVHLLRHETLEAMAGGRCGDHILEVDAMPVIAARLLMRLRERLFDQDGRHKFRERPGSPAYLLRALARPFLFDVPLSQLTSPDFHRSTLGRLYESFFEQSRFVDSLSSNDIGLVGISVAMGPQLAPALIMARWLKTRRPDIAVVLGGPTMSLMRPEDLAALLGAIKTVDAVVKFDGEFPLLELVRQRLTGIWRPERVPGVSCLVANRITSQPPQPGPRLDVLPYGDYTNDIMSQLVDPELGIMQARGCYWGKCAYCDYVELYKGSPPYRTKSPMTFVDEVEFQQRKYGVERFIIITEAIPPAFARKVSELILRRGLRVRWSSFAMVDKRFDTGLFSLMAEAGCDHLVVGLETMSDRVLKKVRKSATRAENVRFLLSAKAAGMRLKVNLIPDLPSTTYDEALDSLEILKGLRDCIWSVSVFPFEATSSSAIGRAPSKFGLTVLDNATSAGQAQFVLNHLEIDDPGMSQKERQVIRSVYRQFANEVNSCNQNERLPNLESPIDDHHYLRIPQERLDFAKRDEFLHCYDWKSRQRFRMHKGWWRLICELQAVSPFRKSDFLRRFSPGVGEYLLAELQRNNLLDVGTWPVSVASDMGAVSRQTTSMVPRAP